MKGQNQNYNLESDRNSSLEKFDADQEAGANLTEYALLVALIAVVCLIALKVLGG